MRLRLTQEETKQYEQGKLTAIGRSNSKVLEGQLLELGVRAKDRERGAHIWTWNFFPFKEIGATLYSSGFPVLLKVSCILYNYLPAKDGMKAEYRWIFEIVPPEKKALDGNTPSS